MAFFKAENQLYFMLNDVEARAVRYIRRAVSLCEP